MELLHLGWNDYWLLVWTLLLSLWSRRCVAGDLAIYTYSGNSTSISNAVTDDGHRLTYVKLGVAVGMFSITAAACAFPLFLMICVTRRMRSRTSCVTAASNGPHSGDAIASRASRMDDREASSLDPQSTESEELLLTRGPDSQASETPQTPNLSTPFYEIERQEDTSVLRDDHRLHWGDGSMRNGTADDVVAGVFNGSATANGGIPPSVPIKSIRRRSSHRRMRMFRRWASRINCFAAGIFLSTGLMDLFPEVQDATAVALSALKINSQYPFSSLFTLLGFFMVLSVEQCVHICHKRRHRHPSYDRRSDEASTVSPHQRHSHSHDPETILGSSAAEDAPSTFRIMLLLIALSVHSIFEGLAVGLQRSVSEVMTLFSALILHKIIMAISTGVSLATAHNEREGGIPRSQWVGALFFALASPIGVLIGWALIAQRSSPALLMAIAVLQGLACGTFFFVVFCEMLPHEFSESESDTVSVGRDRIGKIFSLVLGFALIAAYIAFEPE
ncbi:Zinc transporter ZIP1 [Taenia crassiceps]|uniref:Zinc transporter ZIP1 n=1 Tax=Taenia crassiceps TaxID=6207 RepID=A0ABR4QLT4_9CEST